jgi:U3 small nucleolar RNA-associated protein 14
MCLSAVAVQSKLAQMRALLFYHETKAKHLKKIKSKAYHRKLKKCVAVPLSTHSEVPLYMCCA